MDQTPPEILHQIFGLVDPKDVAALRLICKTFSTVGAQYLVPIITFHCSQPSLDRLRKVSQHPVFSQFVTQICYEATALQKAPDIYTFHNMSHTGPPPWGDPPDFPDTDASEREFRLFARNNDKWVREQDETLSSKKVTDKFISYTTEITSREAARSSFRPLLLTAIPCFPRLRTIELNNCAKCQHVLSERFREAFSNLVTFSCVDVGSSSTPSQFFDLLCAASKVESGVLQKLVLAAISPGAFYQSKSKQLFCFKNAMSSLSEIDLSFRAENVAELHAGSASEYYYLLNQGCLQAFLAQSPDLERLRVAFDDLDYQGPALNTSSIFGDNSFKNLKSLFLTDLDTTENSLVACLLRQSSLEDLQLGRSVLVRGKWKMVLDELRKHLNLKVTRFFDFLDELDGPIFHTDHLNSEAFYADPLCQITLADDIEMYLTDKEFFGTEFNPLDRPEAYECLHELEMQMVEAEEEAYAETMAEMGEKLSDYGDVSDGRSCISHVCGSRCLAVSDEDHENADDAHAE